MTRSRLLLWFILALTLIGLAVDLPAIPVKLKLGPLQIDTAKPAFPTKLGLDLQGGTHLVFDARMEDIPREQRETAINAARKVIERRVNLYGLTEPLVQSSRAGDRYRIIVELPGVEDTSAAVKIIGQTAQLQFRKFKTEASPSAFPTLENTESVGISGKDVASAKLDFNQKTGEPVVAFSLTPEASERFAKVTEELVGKPLAIFLDAFPLSWPTVNEKIEGSGIISGSFSVEQAKNLALQISAGALPVPIKLVEKRTIGPSLGQESIDRSIRAGGIGLAAVAFFMIAYYGQLGAMAVAALVVYGILSFAAFKIIPITLTLPGLAGFILSIGMAVDANILIFERMREELRAGKPVRLAQELGFGRAWDSIRDANVNTIIVCFILFNPLNWSFLNTSGPVRGFAATLFIGVVTSLFTGIAVTRTLLRVFSRDHD
jgi:preprotein translocase subunit SecD